MSFNNVSNYSSLNGVTGNLWRNQVENQILSQITGQFETGVESMTGMTGVTGRQFSTGCGYPITGRSSSFVLEPRSTIVGNKVKIVCDVIGVIPRSIKFSVIENVLHVFGLCQVRLNSGVVAVREFRRAYYVPSYVRPRIVTPLFTEHGQLIIECPILETTGRQMVTGLGLGLGSRTTVFPEVYGSQYGGQHCGSVLPTVFGSQTTGEWESVESGRFDGVAREHGCYEGVELRNWMGEHPTYVMGGYKTIGL